MDIETARGLAKNAFAQEVNTIHRAYIDIAGDLIAGLLFSQIMYWFTPSADGKSKLRVRKKDGYWLAKSREDWYKEVRISKKQYDRAVKILTDKGLVETKLYRFNGNPTVHIRPIMETYNRLLDEWIENKTQEIVNRDDSEQENITFCPKGENPNSQKGNMETTDRVNSLTETTTINTSQLLHNLDNIENHSQGNDSCLCSDIEDKAGRWSWESDKQYVDYMEKMLPKYIRKIANEHYKENDRAYTILLNLVTKYFKMFRSYNGKYHPWYKEETLNSAIKDLHDFFGSFNQSDVEDYMEQFFSHKDLRCKPLKVFTSYGMLEVLRNEIDQDWSEYFN